MLLVTYKNLTIGAFYDKIYLFNNACFSRLNLIQITSEEKGKEKKVYKTEQDLMINVNK